MLFSIFLLFLIFLIEGIYGIVINSKGDYCLNESFSSERCVNNSISVSSLANRIDDEESFYIKSWLNFASIIIILIFLQYFRRHQRLTDREIDRGLTSASDYTIMLTKLPAGAYTESDIKAWIWDLWKSGGFSIETLEIKRVILALDIRNYVEIVKKKEKIQLKIAKIDFLGKINEEEKQKLNIELERMRKEKGIFEKELSKEIERNTCGVAFVTLAFQERKEKFGFLRVFLYRT